MKKSPLSVGFMFILFTCLFGVDIQNISPATAYKMTKKSFNLPHRCQEHRGVLSNRPPGEGGEYPLDLLEREGAKIRRKWKFH
jgi:hypothetical protein